MKFLDRLRIGSAALSPSALPTVEAEAQYAWRDGWWQGIAVGVVIGACVATILFKH